MNKLYLKEKPLFELDYEIQGFRWIDADNNQQNIASYMRTDRKGNTLVIVLNFSPNVYYDFTVAV
ncbi:alpha amylase C-terminal domain-containing protein, partial [Faecalibacillus intestinalis]